MRYEGAPDFRPYKGLQPYTEADFKYFFGRNRDSEIIASNLLSIPLTVLYGATGVGKSSVLMAGVIPQLKKTPRIIPVVFRGWHQERFASALKERLSTPSLANSAKRRKLYSGR